MTIKLYNFKFISGWFCTDDIFMLTNQMDKKKIPIRWSYMLTSAGIRKLITLEINRDDG